LKWVLQGVRKETHRGRVMRKMRTGSLEWQRG
jgi:hypothetical protein